MSLRERWEGLSPTLRRALVLAGAIATVLSMAALLVTAPNDERANGAEERRRLITNLLTDADPRAIGIEGLAERLRRLETHMGQLTASLDKLGLDKGADPERDALIEGLRRENVRQLGDLRRQQEALRQELAAAGTTPALPPPEHPTPPAELPAEKTPAPPPAPRPLAKIFDPSPSGSHTKPETLRLPTAGPDAAHNAKPLEIRLVAAERTTEEGEALPEDAVLIPAGSILRGVLLSGMDAPTGRQSRRDPYPALARLKHDAILPNRFRADVRECFLVLAGYGTGEDVAAVGGDEEHPLPRLDHLHPGHGEALHAADAPQQLADAAGLRGARSRGVGFRGDGQRGAANEGEHEG